jgi:hypothetical protein
MNESEHREDRPVHLCSFYHLTQADSFKATLESQGIQVFLIGDNIASIAPFYSDVQGGIKVFVRLSQYEKARALRDRLVPRSKSPGQLGEGARHGEVQCPDCGSNSVLYSRGISPALTFLLLVSLIGSLALPFIPKRYTCRSCGRRWRP